MEEAQPLQEPRRAGKQSPSSVMGARTGWRQSVTLVNAVSRMLSQQTRGTLFAIRSTRGMHVVRFEGCLGYSVF